MIITCPHCQTRYQVADRSISAAGRQVQCAHCHMSWHATRQEAERDVKTAGTAAGGSGAVATETGAPAETDDALFNQAHEDDLDAQFEAEERRTAMAAAHAPPRSIGKVDLALVRKRRNALLRRQRELTRKLPPARLRRLARITGISLLVAVVAGGIWFRDPVVAALPSLAGLYSAIGLPVNVVGLTISDARTVRARRDGRDVLQIQAKIFNVAGRDVRVPKVRVNLLNTAGKSVYTWRVTPDQKMMSAGESMDFRTELAGPPQSAARVRLDFAGGGPLPETSAKTAASLASGE